MSRDDIIQRPYCVYDPTKRFTHFGCHPQVAPQTDTQIKNSQNQPPFLRRLSSITLIASMMHAVSGLSHSTLKILFFCEAE